MMEENFELVHGSGNVYRDFGEPDADVRQAKAILAAKIIGILDDKGLSTRKAQALTGVDQADFSRIRNAKLTRFTIDRLISLVNLLGCDVDVQMSIHPRQPPTPSPRPAPKPLRSNLAQKNG